jgi:hypothetical protein
MAKPNFKFQKRQKELDRKKKQDEKVLRKQEKTAEEGAEGAQPDDEGDTEAAAEPEA